MNRAYEESALFEHKFWIRVLGDHSQFLLDALAPKETEDIQRAMYFVKRFDTLLNRINIVSLKVKKIRFWNLILSLVLKIIDLKGL